ncbi:MAG TPA: ExeM/NucH family extracellular endonuclease [Egicoccus sp.]|nr:ExeM/NucH family extracellular endonuclease [Egicoccus sp.]HSK22985.1 ExeM/NucH family extracellular endonuclease [Egicoccus sp.]
MRRIALLAVVSLFASLLPLSTAVAVTTPGAGAWVNELHYDNVGTDENEFVEVALRDGTDLTGWSVVRYNGANGTAYGTDDLGSLTPTGATDGFSFVTLTYPVNGLQNGAPDGLALVDGDGTVVQFLSYEGSFTATDGPATGTTSTDIGISQTGATTLDPVGASLQLTGTGGAYEDFTWQRTTANTAGAVNTDQTLQGGGGGPTNQPISATCADLTIVQGETGSVELTATDPDGVVVDASITGGATDGITLANAVPATTTGGSLSVDLVADGTVSAGDYDLEVTFANDDATPQTRTCTTTVTVDATCSIPTPISDLNTVGGNGLPNTDRFGDAVAVEAVVTADFLDGLSGFFVQEEDADSDGDPTTSEGIFVYTPDLDEAPEVGTLVCVTGTVGAYQGLYQLTWATVTPVAPDQPLPTAVELVLPVDDLTELAQIAGMRVELTGQDGTMTVAQNYFQGQYGELDLSGAGRLWNPTELYDPESPEAAALREQNQRSLIKLDDANSTQNATPMPWIDNGALRAGAETTDVIEGIAGYQFGAYRVQPTDPDAITFTNTDNPRPADAPDVLAGARPRAETVTVASFNVLNYFTTLTSQDSDARGADTPEEFELQAAKIVTAITKLDADVVGLMEIENNFGEPGDALADLVGRLNAEAGAGTYAAVALDAPVGTDAISNAMIYQPAAVTPVGELAIADHQAFVNPRGATIDRNRPAIAQAFETADGEVFVTVVNHLKSKGSACGAGDDGELTGSCNLTRTLAAEELVRWLDEDDPTGTGSDRIAIIGDLNSYAQEDPIDVLREAGYVDTLGDQLGSAYSYVFDGELGRLDHAFLSASLDEHLVGAAEWHINADEPNGFDYNDWNDPANQDESEFRSSDHDPVVVGLAFGPDSPASKDECKNGGWREFTDPEFRNQGQCVAWVVTQRLREVLRDFLGRIFHRWF